MSLNTSNSETFEFVREWANEWSSYANIKFKFVSFDNSADIRVSFDNKGGSWPTIGTDAKKVSRNNATMNLESEK